MSATSLLLSLKNNKNTQSPFFSSVLQNLLPNSCDGFYATVVRKGKCLFPCLLGVSFRGTTNEVWRCLNKECAKCEYD